MSTTSKKRAENGANICRLQGIGPPHAKQIEILQYLLKPDPDNVKLVDVVCGRGFGKTLLSILIAVYCLSIDGNQVGLFLEPDKPRMDKAFRLAWRQIVPQHLWSEVKSERMIIWANGSVLYYGHRDIRASLEDRRDLGRGPNISWIISDEEAVKTDIQQYSNFLASVRHPSPVRFYLTITTPKIGAFKQLISMPGHKVFTGTSYDNPYLPPGFVETLKDMMSRDEFAREVLAQFVALEGRIWREFDMERKWPEGNVHHGLAEFDKSRPWWLFCDMGSATAAYLVVQQVPAVRFGERIFDGNVWVAVADLCPYHDASAVRAFNKLKSMYGMPRAVTGGNDINTRASTDGKSIAYHARKVWPNVRIIPVDERDTDKTIQFDRLSYLICSGTNNRRFCIAKNFREIEPEGRRGLKQMLEEDVFPDEPGSATEFLPKKKEILVQHIRDAALMGAVAVMSPPRWGHEKETTK